MKPFSHPLPLRYTYLNFLVIENSIARIVFIAKFYSRVKKSFRHELLPPHYLPVNPVIPNKLVRLFHHVMLE